MSSDPTPAPAGPPPPPGEGRKPFRVALVTAGAGLVLAVVLFVVVANNLGSGETSDAPGRRADTELFVVGDAKSLADAVKRDGPLLLPDLLGGSRDIYLQNLGGAEWRAFDSRPPGAPRRCTLQWARETRLFTDPCSGGTYPADGTGLVSYRARVDDEGRVVVDLRDPIPAVPTTHGPS